MLKSLRVRHFKSLGDVAVELSPVTLLVGPNGTGKSNIVDALRFLRDALVHGLDYAITDRGGITVLRQHSQGRPFTVGIGVELKYTFEDGQPYAGTYDLRIASTKGDYRVEEEIGEWTQEAWYTDDLGNASLRSKNIKLERSRDGEVLVNGNAQEREMPADRLALDTVLGDGFFRFSNPVLSTLSALRFLSIYPNTLRKPSRPDSDKQLREDCRNWASVIKAMRGRRAGEQGMHRIVELMRTVIPGLKNVRVQGVGGYLVPQFLVEDRPGAKPHYYDPIQLSDGTLRLLAMLLVLYQAPRPTFLALEEPEQTIHPGLLGVLADAFREVCSGTQLLITTHSPHLIDYFHSNEIRVVTLEDGETQVSPVRASQVQTVKGGLMALDGLKPELAS
jgi:predicted ATPase